MTPRSTASRARAVISWLGSVLAWSVLLLLVAAVLSAVAVPRVVGATPYAVLSSSMEPRYPPGSLLVVRPVPAEQLRLGDVITYQLRSGRPEVVSHRITAIGFGADGSRSFRTKGDHNGSVDPEPVRPEQIRGRLWYAVPVLGRLATGLAGDRRLVVTGVVAALLVGYAGALVVSGLRDRRRSLERECEPVAP